MSERTPTIETSSESSPDLNRVISDALTLRWPEYVDGDTYDATRRAKIEALEAAEPELSKYYNGSTDVVNVNVNGYYQPLSLERWDSISPAEIREIKLEDNLRAINSLADLLADGPFAACNQKVAEAFQNSITEVTDALRQAMDLQEDGGNKYTSPTYSYDAGLSAQALLHTLAGISVQFGTLPYEEASMYYNTQNYRGVFDTSKTINNGRRNRYGIRYLEPMQDADDDSAKDEEPTYLDITAIPGKRVAFELAFLSDQLSERFQSTSSNNGRTTTSETFSMRIDYDDKSSNGFSLDIGRDLRLGDNFKRDGDPAGNSLITVRPEGSHFTSSFDSVTPGDMEEFIAGVRDILTADAEMHRYDQSQKRRPN